MSDWSIDRREPPGDARIEGVTPFDAFHAATAETWGVDVLSSEKDYGDIEVSRVPLKPSDEE